MLTCHDIAVPDPGVPIAGPYLYESNCLVVFVAQFSLSPSSAVSWFSGLEAVILRSCSYTGTAQ